MIVKKQSYKMKRYKVFSVWEYFLLVGFLLLSVAFFYFSYQDLNYKAYQSLKNKEIELAQVYSQQAIEKNPSQLLNYLNLALSYDLNKQNKEAEETYHRAVSRFLDKDTHSFFLYFNKAEFYSRLESHPEKALQAYQKALEFNYKEDLVKKNIEWLFKDKKAPEDLSDDTKGGSQSKQNNEEEADKENKGEKGKEQQGEDQSQNKGAKEEDSEDKSKDREENQTDKKEESQEKDQSEKEKEEGDKKSQEESNEAGKGKSDQEENQDGGVGSNQEEEEELSGEESLSKSFDFDRSQEIDEKAILEEIQKQESQARSRFYKGKRTFGDKTDKNW